MPPTERRPARRPSASARGSALVFVLAMLLVLAVAGIALVRIAGNDRIDAARMGQNDRALACAEAGLQYARRYFGSNYETTSGWNALLSKATPGFRYDPANGDGRPDLSSVPKQAVGMSNGATLDPGADLDGDGQPDFWVSIRDDDDERPLGIPDDPTRDNNEAIIIRSECTNPRFALPQGGTQVNMVLESVLSHVQGSSGYGTSEASSNSTDLVGGR